MAKQVTREQAERKKAQAAAFMERIGQPERAEEFAGMSVEEYAERKGLRLANPNFRRRAQMASTSLPSKTDLQDQIDQAIEILDDAYEPESTREDLAEAVGSALDILRGEEAEDESEEEIEDIDED